MFSINVVGGSMWIVWSNWWLCRLILGSVKILLEQEEYEGYLYKGM
jgi:hypothetical protein